MTADKPVDPVAPTAVALARAMAEAGYADPDPVEQWRLPDGEAVLRQLSKLGFRIVRLAPAPQVEGRDSE